MAQINKPSDYFNTKLYTGNGSTQSISSVGFQPDFTWIKQRDGTFGHDLYDALRGATKVINTNNNLAEYTESARLTSFDSDGFSLGSETPTNGNGNSYASWNWLASNTTASNTDGSITSTVSANTTSGFSIVSYTGTGSNATIGHGLGSVPKMIIVKNRDSAVSWSVYHNSLGATKYILLNSTDGSATVTSWNNTEPTSSVFSVGTLNGVNSSSTDYIAYCFAEKPGFSKFGSYTGNGSADGTFVYTGFKPAWVMVKRSNNTQGWYMLDNKRNTFNPEDKYLEANDSDAEATFTFCDFLSNGFKARVDNTGTGFNFSGDTYIYMAFAESPLVGTNNIPATAR